MKTTVTSAALATTGATIASSILSGASAGPAMAIVGSLQCMSFTSMMNVEFPKNIEMMMSGFKSMNGDGAVNDIIPIESSSGRRRLISMDSIVNS